MRVTSDLRIADRADLQGGLPVNFGARAVIRLGALQQNLNVIRSQAPEACVMAMIKANAYGHGLVPVARSLAAADSLGVARLSEAVTLREAGIQSSLVLLEGVQSGQDLAIAMELGCEIVVHSSWQVDLLESPGAGNAVVWLKVDTGMNRLGVSIDEADALRQRLAGLSSVAELRMMTHLANADRVDDPMTDRQFDRFEATCADFQGDVSIANSGGLFGWQSRVGALPVSGQRQWIRPGIALYGVSPFPSSIGSELGLQPVMEFSAELIAVKKINSGERVGYGGGWQCERDSLLGVISAGYGDGYTRFLPNGVPVLVNGRRVPVVGAISMDMITVDLGPQSTDQVGDNVTLWGASLPVEELAVAAGTIPYQLLTGLTHRESPVFLESTDAI